MNGSDLVTDARKERIRGYLRIEDKARCLVAGLLLRRVCGVTDDCQLTYNMNGKPYLKNQSINFNISHSGDYVVLATANREIGVDIEKIADYPDKIVIRCFTSLEREWMKQEKETEAFYRLWTAKESVMKASGFGLSLPPEVFSVLPMNTSGHYIAGKTWFLDWIPYDNYMICLTIEGKAEKTEVITITPTDLLIALNLQEKLDLNINKNTGK